MDEARCAYKDLANARAGSIHIEWFEKMQDLMNEFSRHTFIPLPATSLFLDANPNSLLPRSIEFRDYHLRA